MNARTVIRALGACALAIILSSSTAPAAPGETGDALVARATVFTDFGVKFRADAYDAPIVRDGERLPNFTLVIQCIQGCPKKISYTESTSDYPVSIFLFSEGSNQLVTYWESGGSAVWVRIYRLSTTGIEKVFDQSTREVQVYGFATDDTPVVVLRDRYDPHPEGTFEARGQIWKWDGKQYRLVRDAH